MTTAPGLLSRLYDVVLISVWWSLRSCECHDLYEPDENRVLEGVEVVLRHLFVFCYLPPGVMHPLFKRRRSDVWTRQSSFQEEEKSE